jgi:hypothetical protein
LAKKIFKVFVFPCHSISGKNVRSIERVTKPKPNNNSRKSNRDRRKRHAKKIVFSKAFDRNEVESTNMSGAMAYITNGSIPHSHTSFSSKFQP